MRFKSRSSFVDEKIEKAGEVESCRDFHEDELKAVAPVFRSVTSFARAFSSCFLV